MSNSSSFKLPSGATVTMRPIGLLALRRIYKGQQANTEDPFDNILIAARLVCECMGITEEQFEEYEIADQLALIEHASNVANLEGIEEKLRPFAKTETLQSPSTQWQSSSTPDQVPSSASG